MQLIAEQQLENIEQAQNAHVDEPTAVTIEGAEELHSGLDEIADSFDVTGFKCAKCGLVHMHDTTKHRLSDTFDVDESIAGSTEYNSVCHCGVQAAARNGSEYGIDEESAAEIASNAPVPPEAATAMDEELGTL